MIATIRAVLVSGFLLLQAAAAGADPIQIAGGGLTYNGGPLTITLTSAGFTFEGRASAFAGVFMPREQCLFGLACVPGSTVDLLAYFVDLDLPGTATFDGRTWRTGSLTAPASVSAMWTGSLPIPADYASGALTAPFEFTGSFQYFDATTLTGGTIDLFGRGTATASFVPAGLPDGVAPNALYVDSIRYDFEAAAAPTPEPASIVLMGSGVVTLWFARRRRRIAPPQ